MTYQTIAAVLISLAIPALAAGAETLPSNPGADQIQKYWYPKGAEISRFSLAQSRYGEIHDGEAVLIFVTEAMDPVLQVKADRPGPGDVPMLKLNATRKFYTGIYPYSVMTSVFSPVDAVRRPLPLKITFSGQEWCGHVFAQLNLREDRYRAQVRSYFESEGDRDFRIEATLPEDALLNLIRLAPADLPTGRFSMIPSTLYTRLLHRPMAPRPVEASISATSRESLEGAELTAYKVRYVEEDRTLTIWFETRFPHRIQAWEETHPSPARFGAKRLTTRAERTHTLMTDYWNKNRPQDRRLLEQLGIDPN